MQKTERELTDVEMIDTLDEILDLIIETYDKPLRKDFEKQSRPAQFGYDILRMLMEKGLLSVGSEVTKDGQYKIKGSDRQQDQVL